MPTHAIARYAAPLSPATGEVYYDIGDKLIKTFDGTEWVTLGPPNPVNWEFSQDGPNVWVVDIHNLTWAAKVQPDLEAWLESTEHGALMNTHDNKLKLFLYTAEDATYFRLRFRD